MKKNARETALEVLTACRKLDAWSDGSLKSACQRNGLDRREAAMAARLTYGILQNMALLDFYLGQYCSQKFSQLEPFVRDVLRLGAYQILMMDKVPDSAAVNEAVEMAKHHKRARAAGMINAVLRRLSREKDSLPAIAERPVEEYLALRYSHPVWLVKRLLEILGREEAEAFLAADNEPVPLTIQRNPLRCSREELLDYWQKAGAVITPHSWLEDCYELTGTGSLEEQEAFRAGWFQVQDAAAKVAALAAGAKEGDSVIDVCAAPGGKSFAAAMEMNNRGRIRSFDIHPHKLALIESGAERLGITCVETALGDGRENIEALNGSADVVICDVPCSGLGIIRKKPDIRYKDPKALAALPGIQRAILENACRYVKSGGVLLYSTCTILPEENDGLVSAFLAEHPEFHTEAISVPSLEGGEEGRMTLWPQRHRTDGFYLCKMRKV